MDESYGEIATAIQAYFDGFHTGDVGKLRGIFHDSAHLYSAPDGALADDDMTAVYARVEGRVAPAAKGEPRHDRILSIDRSGPESALVVVQISIAPKLYTDYLSLLKIDGRWRIISKTFTAAPLAEASVQPTADAAE